MKVSNTYEELWSKVLHNDKQAFEQIYRYYYPNLFQYALKLTNEWGIAEDALQDIFLYLWQHRHQIGRIQSLQFYLLRSTRNACIKMIRKRNNISSLEAIDKHIVLHILPNELELTTTNNDIKKRVKTALAELSPRQREIIFLKFYNNLDYEEIGVLLDINYQSVVNHIYRAVQKLRKSKTLKFFKGF